MKRITVLLAILISSLFATSAMAENSEARQWAGAVLKYGGTENKKIDNPGAQVVIPWEVPMFWMKQKEQMTVKVNAVGGGTFCGSSISDVASWLEKSHLRLMQGLGPARNITIFTGPTTDSDLLMEVEARVLSGKQWLDSKSKYSRESSGYGNTNKDAVSSASGKTDQLVYLTLQPILYRVGKNGRKEIVCAPEARISAEQSETISQYSRTSSSIADSYKARKHGTVSWGESSSDSISSGIDENYSKMQLLDPLSQNTSSMSVALIFKKLPDYLILPRYQKIKEAEASIDLEQVEVKQ